MVFQSAMIEVQMAVDDDIDIFRRDARCGELVEQLRGLAVDLDHAFGKLVAYAGFDQHGLRSGANYDRIQSQRDEIVALGLYLAFPQASGNDAEHAAAIKVVGPVREGGKFEIAQGHTLHGIRPSLKAYHYPQASS